jgi:hypothetical protein
LRAFECRGECPCIRRDLAGVLAELTDLGAAWPDLNFAASHGEQPEIARSLVPVEHRARCPVRAFG